MHAIDKPKPSMGTEKDKNMRTVFYLLHTHKERKTNKENCEKKKKNNQINNNAE